MGRDSSIWVKIDKKLKYAAPVFLLLLLVYLHSSLISPVLSKDVLQYVEITIIAYFVSELLVKYVISDDYIQFLRDYWLDIVLVVPFFKSIKLLGSLGKALKSIKGLSYIKYVRKLAKVPKMIPKMGLFRSKSEEKTTEKNE